MNKLLDIKKFLIRGKIVFLPFVIFSIFIGSFNYFTKYLIYEYDTGELRENLKGLAEISARTIDTNAYKTLIDRVKSKNLTIEEKISLTESIEFRAVREQLAYIKSIRPELIGSVYLMVPTNSPEESLLIVDDATTKEEIEESRTSREDWQTYVVFPGNLYDIHDQPVTMQALSRKENIVDTELRYDSTWDKHSLMGFAPIFGKDNEYLGILGIDLYNVDIEKQNASINFTLDMTMVLLICIGFIVIIYFTKNLSYTEQLEDAKEILEKSYQQLQELDDKKTKFMNIVSHELRTPMTAIMGYVSMILDDDAGKISKEARTYLEQVLKSSKQLTMLINDMLDMGKLEAGHAELYYEEIEMGDFIKTTISSIESLALDRKQKIDVILDYDTLMYCADARRIRQILINIVGNAIKYTPKNGKITIHSWKDEKSLIIEVADTGIGISDKHRDFIFEKFSQIKNPLTRDIGGTGLGLAITKSIVEKFSGSIEVKSKEGEGSIFTVKLPL